jgi:hypothetical protein
MGGDLSPIAPGSWVNRLPSRETKPQRKPLRKPESREGDNRWQDDMMRKPQSRIAIMRETAV